MFGRFMPTEGKFFEYFNQHAECAVKAAHALKELVNDLPNAEMHARNVQNFERRPIASRMTRSNCCTRLSSPRLIATRSTS